MTIGDMLWGKRKVVHLVMRIYAYYIAVENLGLPWYKFKLLRHILKKL